MVGGSYTNGTEDVAASRRQARTLLLGGGVEYFFDEASRPTGPLVKKPSEPLLEAAVKYWRQCTGEKSGIFSRTALHEAALKGDELLNVAGHWKPAVETLRYAWEVVLKRGHIGDIWSPYWETVLPSDLLQYLRTQKFQGARARQNGTSARIRAKPHMGALQNLAQVWEALWKDVFAGRTLVTSADHPGLSQGNDVTLPDGSVETRPGVYSVPANAVCKLNPDRTISSKIRPVNDLRGAQ